MSSTTTAGEDAGQGASQSTSSNLSSVRTEVGSVKDAISSLKSQYASESTVHGDSKAAVAASDIQVYEPASSELDSKLAEVRKLAEDTEGMQAVLDADPLFLKWALYARKGDVERAMLLVKNYVDWRVRVGADKATPENTPSLYEQLKSGFMVSAGTRDVTGRAVVFLRLRLHNPDKYSALHTVQLAAFVLEWTMRTYPYALTHGVVFFQDMQKVKLRNFDFRVPGEMRNAFAQTLPVRVASMNVVNPPAFMRIIFAVVSPLMSQKLKTRTRLVATANERAKHIDADQMLQDYGLGAEKSWTDEMHNAWCERVKADLAQ